MSVIGVIWLVLIVLKLLGVALVGASWLTVIFWPIIPFILLAIAVFIFGVSASVLRGY